MSAFEAAARTARVGGRGTALLVEALALLVVLALVFAKLASVSAGTWRTIFLANGDSLVLPLLLQSLQRGEVFHWTFSSQTFFFPEFPLYALCGLLMGTPQGGLILNAVLNVVLLYVGFRAIAAALAPTQRLRQLLGALGGTVLFLGAVLTETDVHVVGVGTVEPSRIATVFLMTSYYGGALLVSLGMLALVFRMSGRFGQMPVSRRQILVLGAVVTVAGGAVTYSNPLFLLWFVAPLGVTLLVLLITRRATLRSVLILAFPQVVGVGVGMLAREIFSQFVSANYDTYIVGQLAQSTGQLLSSVLAEWLSSVGGIVRLAILVIPVAYAVFFVVTRARTPGRTRETAPTAEVFLSLFIVVSAVSLVVGEIVTGQTVTRYLLPLFVFPPMAIFLLPLERLADRLGGSRVRIRRVAALGVAIAGLATVGTSAPAVADLASPRPPVDTACLTGWLDGRALNGVGSFWVVRALELYGNQRGRLLQVTPYPIGVHAWMNNLALYDDVRFSYAVAGGDVSGADLRRSFGAPAEVVRCSGYSIYDYAGTPGADLIDTMVVTTLQRVSLQHHY